MKITPFDITDVTFRGEQVIHVVLPKEVEDLLNSGNVFEAGNVRRSFLPFVFEKDIGDQGNIYRMHYIDKYTADEIGLPQMELRRLTDEEFNAKYPVAAVRNFNDYVGR